MLLEYKMIVIQLRSYSHIILNNGCECKMIVIQLRSYSHIILNNVVGRQDDRNPITIVVSYYLK